MSTTSPRLQTLKIIQKNTFAIYMVPKYQNTSWQSTSIQSTNSLPCNDIATNRDKAYFWWNTQYNITRALTSAMEPSAERSVALPCAEFMKRGANCRLVPPAYNNNSSRCIFAMQIRCNRFVTNLIITSVTIHLLVNQHKPLNIFEVSIWTHNYNELTEL